MVILFIYLLIASTGEAYADLNLKYTVTIEKGSSTSHVQLYIANIGASYLDIEFRSEAQDQDIESYVSNLTAESDSYPLTITDTGDGKWRINSPGSTVTVDYDIKKIIYFDWPHLYASNELAVYIDDEYGFLMAPFFFIYPDTDIESIQIKFDVPDDWKVLTQYLEEDDHFTVEQTGTSLLSSFITRQLYMGKMKFYAEEWAGSCKVQMGVPEGDDNYWELQTLEEVENYVHATALALAEFTRVFGDNPYSVYTMYPNFQEYLDEQWFGFQGWYIGNGLQYWPEHRWSELTCHMSLSFMSMWFDSPLKVEFNIEKGIGEMYYGHTLAWLLFNDETYLAQMYYWYLVYDRMHGTWLTDALFAGNKEYPAYVKGEWVALLLDKKIQEVTQGSKSLDNVMNNLYSKYKQTGHEVSYQDLQNEVESITGSDFSAFFSQYVNGDEKIPVYQYVEPYKEYFLNLPDVLEETFHLRLYGKTFPLFILIEMTINLQEHIMAGMYYQPYLDEFADYILSSYSIEQITESDVENALSQLTGKDCSGFFDRWENSFGRLSLEELKEWLYAYQGNAPTVIRGGGCFIATVAYDSPMEPHVKVLRQFRDSFLLSNSVGKAFMRLYYTCSPPVADFIARHDAARSVVRWSLLPLVSWSWVAINLGLVPALVFMLLLLALISATTVVLFRKILLLKNRT
tara:strand:- start:88 stop:2139 length:2052 start_codon:yes stop_codon:yes gene_type:complete